MEEKLLDILALQTGCRYLSQLREEAQRRMLCGALTRLAPERFSVSQWLETAQYLMGREVPQTVPRTQAALAQCLEKWLEAEEGNEA